MRHFWLAIQVGALDRLPHHAIRLGDAFALAQMLEPQFHQEGFQVAPGFGRLLEDTPRMGTIATAFMSQPRCAGSTRYSTVTNTGPRSYSMSNAVTGGGQCIDGERSISPPA